MQIIELDGQPAAIAAGGQAIIAAHVRPHQLRHVQAKALYALQIQAGERPGPYTDRDAEHYAAGASTPAATSRKPRRRRNRVARAYRHAPREGPD